MTAVRVSYDIADAWLELFSQLRARGIKVEDLLMMEEESEPQARGVQPVKEVGRDITRV